MKKSGAPFRWKEIQDTRITLGKDLILVKQPSVAYFESKFQLDSMIFLIWSKGSIEGSINFMPYKINSNSVLIIRPHQAIHVEKISDDFSACFILISNSFLDKLQINITNFASPVFFKILKDNSLVQLPSGAYGVVNSYFKLLFRVLLDDDNPLREQCAINLTRSFIFEAAYYLQKNTDLSISEMSNPIVSRLIHLIQKNFRTHRDISFYAAQMKLSPNHLYKIAKSVSGKSVAEWIEDYTITEAKMLLGSYGLSVKEVSDRLNFPSQSYFGKYFKRIVGISPKNYKMY